MAGKLVPNKIGVKKAANFGIKKRQKNNKGRKIEVRIILKKFFFDFVTIFTEKKR